MVHRDDLLQKAAVGFREHLRCGSICRSDGSKVGNGVHGFLLDLLVEVLHGVIVDIMISRVLVILLHFEQFLMGNGEIYFKMRPGLIVWVAAAPIFSVVGEHGGFEDEVLGGGDHFLRQIHIVGSGHNVHGIADLLNEDLHRLIYVVIGTHPLVIVLNTSIQNFRISKVKVRQHILGGDVGVSNVFVPEESNVGLFNGGNEKGIEGLVRHVVLGIKGRVDVILTANVCNLCCH